MKYQNNKEFAKQLDKEDPLVSYRKQFHFPIIKGNKQIYFCGNSLGLQPKGVKKAVNEELDAWAELGVEGHFKSKFDWFGYHHFLTAMSARLVGAKNKEVVVMNNLTTNLHLMMVSFYRPTKTRFKILMEANPFPSDRYALESQIKFHGFDPAKTLIELKPKEGKHNLCTDDIISTIEEHKDSLALVMMGGVNYYTGQAFEMDKITEAAHNIGALAGFDLAHAAGNLHLQLNKWKVDFAVWCTYKYLNSGPGGTSGVYINEKHVADKTLPRFAGWWGNNEKTRFLMQKEFDPTPTAEGWQLSNAQILPMAVHRTSLEMFDKAGIKNLRKKSVLLTGYLEYLLNDLAIEDISILTPKHPDHRGCQLSIVAKARGKKLHAYLQKHHIISDWREPDVIRVAPVPLYNSFIDVWELADRIRKFYMG
ncbi:MAG: kynureninase [Bacteroidota bacterium]|nr:kynureninase [Bacteroidota bacterium]